MSKRNLASTVVLVLLLGVFGRLEPLRPPREGAAPLLALSFSDRRALPQFRPERS